MIIYFERFLFVPLPVRVNADIGRFAFDVGEWGGKKMQIHNRDIRLTSAQLSGQLCEEV